MADAPESRTESPILSATLVLASFLIAFGALHYGFYTRKLLLDTPLYERYGDAMVHHGRLPYRDFSIEYPPAALPVFAAPSLVAAPRDFRLYSRIFEAMMLVCGAVASALVAFVLTRQRAGRTRLVGGILLAGLAPLALGPVVLSRFDLWPAALTAGALAALVADRRRLAFAVLGAAIAAKLYPGVLVPLAVAYVWRRNGRREAVTGGAIAAAVAGACYLPFLVASPAGVWSSLSRQAHRPLQIESLGSGLLLAAHHLWSVHVTEVASNGSDNLAGRLPDALGTAQSVLGVAVLVAIWIGFARGEATLERLLRYAAGAVCAFIALNKVLSPQYLMWLFALIPLVRGRRGAVASGLFVVSMVLTQLWFPSHYISLVYGLNPRASWLVIARDLVLVALLITLVWPQHQLRRLGVGLVSGLAAVAAAAVTVAAASSAPAHVAMHSGLLDETGDASRCGHEKAVPGVSEGSVAYEVARFVNLSRDATCVNVSLTTQSRLEVFSAAYRKAFVVANARARYLGDAGKCTNVAGFSGRSVAYSFDAPPGGRFAIEVEDCSSAGVVPTYLIDVSGGSADPVAYRSFGARRHHSVVVVQWRTSSEPSGVAFSLYREQGGVRTPATGHPIAARATGAYWFDDRQAPLIRPLRYWLLARTGDGSWSWHGPITSNG